MKYDPKIHHRRPIRLKGYDYSKEGAYFVTICVKNKHCLFGAIKNSEMQPNDAGLMVTRWYTELENKFPDIQCDEFICMPNHVHFIVINAGENPCASPDSQKDEHIRSSLPNIVQWFKTMTTNKYIQGVKQHNSS